MCMSVHASPKYVNCVVIMVNLTGTWQTLGNA